MFASLLLALSLFASPGLVQDGAHLLSPGETQAVQRQADKLGSDSGGDGGGGSSW